jgi:hypothetical protein
VQVTYAEEREVQRLTSRVEPRSTQHDERLTPRSGKCKRLTPKSGEVQEADDEGWGSATATGGETGECKKAIERGKWGHRAAGTAATVPHPAALCERGVGPPEQPTQLQWLRSPTHSPRSPRTLANALALSARSRSQCMGKRLVYKGESERSANWKSRLRTITLQSRTEPLGIIDCKLTKNLTTLLDPTYSYLLLLVSTVTLAPLQTSVLH